MSARTRAQLIEAFLDRARADIGVRESPRGSNRGERIDHYHDVCGMEYGQPWCAMAIATWGVEAMGKAWPLPRTADCDVLLAFARRRRICHQTPQIGDVFLRLAAGDDDDANHAGVVTSTTFGTVEGNTTQATGIREGYIVAARTRTLSSRYRFVRWINLVSSATTSSGEWFARIGPDRIPVDIVGGRDYLPVRAFCRALFGADADRRLAWSEDENTPTWTQATGAVVALPFPVRLAGGTSWAHLPRLCAWQNLIPIRDETARVITFTRPTA